MSNFTRIPGKVFATTTREDMEAFDKLPRRVRDAVNECYGKLACVTVLQMVVRHGEETALGQIKKMNELVKIDGGM